MRLYWMVLGVLGANALLHIFAFLVVFAQMAEPGPGEPDGSAR
jgi:hypothetical protein